MEYTIHLGEDTLKQLDEIVNGGGESGGGSSDFSTAEVTINNITMPSVPTQFQPMTASVIDEEDDDWPACIYTINITPPVGTTRLVLYKGRQIIPNSYQEGKIKNITGSASVTENGLEITGNCSFDIDYTV